ncbi:hypothetical protein EDC96DRAFT_525656 [Choanephora cucurbitarum]|nr:hypothetical protein EDC96DRAFT_525656 [Choanephora cucurbitarum]
MTSALQAIKRTSLSPTRAFFRIPQKISNVDQAREIFKVLRSYGDMVEYKLMRCPETLNYLKYGFVVYKYRESANKAIQDQFIRVQSDLFSLPFDIKIELSQNSTYATKQNKSEA